MKFYGHLNLLTALTAFTPFTYHIPLTSLLFHYSPYSFNILHSLQSLHSPDSTLLRFLPLLFLLVWHPVLYLITLFLDFLVLLLNPVAILTPLHSFDCLYSVYLSHSPDFPPLPFLSLFLWHPVLPSITSLHGLPGTFIILLTLLTFYIHFNPSTPSAHSSSTTLSTSSTSYASITPSVACILFITSLLGLPFFPLLSPLLRLPSILLLSRFL